MHREIMQTPPGMVTDHIDGNGMDNCRGNLRNCTRQQNLCNQAKHYRQRLQVQRRPSHKRPQMVRQNLA